MKSHWLLTALLALSFEALSSAQEITASIAGTVTDESGAVVSGAIIEVKNLDKNALIRKVTTSSYGQYVATSLLVGIYRVSASAPGFRIQQREGITLSANDNLKIDFHLEVGAVTEAVDVQQQQIAVDLETANSSRLLSGNEVRDMAVVTRNFVSLVPLQPGVSALLDTDQPYVGITSPVGGSNRVTYSINGSRPEQNAWTLDGAAMTDRGENLYIFDFPSIDSIQEFNVTRNGYSAEFGGAAAGHVSVITRSGTNQFHGTAYEFLRNDVLSANNFFNKLYDIERQPLRYNDFGFTIGGPIFLAHKYNREKNKTFFFYSQEWRKAINYSTFFISGVPTLDERMGKFSTPVCVDADPFSGNCPGARTNQITAFDPTAAAYIKDVYANVPAPNPDHTLAYAGRETFDFRQINFRIDHIFNAKYSVFARFIDDSIPTVEANGLFSGTSLPRAQMTRTNAPGRGFTARLTASPSPSWLNEAGYAYSYGAILSNPVGTMSSSVSPDIRPTLPFGNAERVPGLFFLSGNGVSGFGPFIDYSRQHALYDTLSWIRGRHTIKSGVTWNHYEKEENNWGSNNGFYYFQGNDAEGNPSFAQQWANLLVGNATFFSQTSGDLVNDVLQNQIELFSQDTYRIRSNLTLNFGLRWSLFRQPTDGNGYASTFDPSRFDPSVAPEIDINTGDLVAGTDTPIVNGMIIGGRNSPYGDAVAQQNNLCFAPRLSFAWDPFSSGRTSVRGGYGLYYETPRIAFRETRANPPFSSTVAFLAPNLSLPAGGINIPNMTPQSISGPVTNWRAPYVQQWSLDIQRQISSTGKLSVGYFGGKGTHLIGTVDFNQPQPGAYRTAGIPAPITAGNTNLLNYVRPYRGYGPITLFATVFSSNYNSLQTHYQQSFGTGSMLSVSYTWSHALTNSPDVYSAPVYNGEIQAEYGPTPYDRRHILSGSYVYYLPLFEAQRGLVGHLLGGWELSGAIFAQAGVPLTVTGAYEDPAGLGVQCCGHPSRLDQLGDANQHAPHTVGRWFDTSVFAEPPSDGNRPGNGRNGTVIGPAAFRWDASILKSTKIGERCDVQFRIEASNVLNHTNFNNVSTNLQDPAFGRVTSARDARVIQLGIKIEF